MRTVHLSNRGVERPTVELAIIRDKAEQEAVQFCRVNGEPGRFATAADAIEFYMLQQASAKENVNSHT